MKAKARNFKQLMVPVLLLCTVITGCAQIGLHREVSERFICKFDFSPSGHGLYSISPDGRRFAYPLREGDKWFAVIDGKKGKKHDCVYCPLFSPDGKRVAYSAKRDGKWFVVLDGKELIPHDRITQALFSPDSERFAYAAGTKRKDIEDEDTEKTASWDDLSDEYFDWSVIIDGKEQKQYGIVYDLTFSANSERFAYMAIVGQRGEPGYRPWESSKDFAVVDGKERKHWDSVSRFTFSPNSEHYAYFAGREIEIEHDLFTHTTRWRVVWDNAESKEYEDLGKAPVFSPDGNHFAYKVKSKWEEYIVLDGKEQKKYRSVSSLLLPNVVFSPDSRHFAYSAYLGSNRTVLVLDGREIEVNCNPMHLVLSPDGKHYAFRGYKGGVYVVVFDGKERPGYEACNPVFSPNSKRFAYRAEDMEQPACTRTFIEVDGEKQKFYDAVGPPLFTQDSRHIVYQAESQNEWFVVVDGNEGRRYDMILNRIIFDPNDSFHYLAVRNNKVYLVEEKLK